MNQLPTAHSIDQLAAPSADGALLVWPPDVDLKALVEANRPLRRSQTLDLPGQPHPSLDDPTTPPVVTLGHQPDFMHAGVWIKIAASVRLAANLRGTARFFVVDSDVADSAAIQWPEFDPAGDRWLRRSVACPGATAGMRYERFGRAGRDDWERCFEEVHPSTENVLDDFRRGVVYADATDLREPADYTTRWIGGISSLQAALGLPSPQFVRVSDVFDFRNGTDSLVDAAARFVAHILIHGRRLAECHNQALAEYRSRRGIRGHARPIPDLMTSSNRVELPFWVVGPSGPRRKLSIAPESDGAIAILADDRRIGGASEKELRAAPREALVAALGDHEIRPRALTLTMYIRLLAGDLFIHGIGGAKYDQVTDGIIRSFFGIEPPRFACVSATLRLPLGNDMSTQADVPTLVRCLRDLQFNPQRHIDKALSDPTIPPLLAERDDAVREAGRLAAGARRNRDSRRAAFHRIRQANRRFQPLLARKEQEFQRQLERARRRQDSAAITGSREWFVALHSADRLREIVTALDRSLTPAGVFSPSTGRVQP